MEFYVFGYDLAVTTVEYCDVVCDLVRLFTVKHQEVNNNSLSSTTLKLKTNAESTSTTCFLTEGDTEQRVFRR